MLNIAPNSYLRLLVAQAETLAAAQEQTVAAQTETLAAQAQTLAALETVRTLNEEKRLLDLSTRDHEETLPVLSAKEASLLGENAPTTEDIARLVEDTALHAEKSLVLEETVQRHIEEQFRNRMFNVLILASLSQLRCKVAELAKKLAEDPGYADRPESTGVRDHVASLKDLLDRKTGLAEKIGSLPRTLPAILASPCTVKYLSSSEGERS